MMLTDLADVLRAAGLTVIELPGWQQRGESGPFDPRGLLLHHDAMGLGWNANPNDDMNVPKYMSQNGVDGSQLWVRKDGAYVVMAAGKKWHAGSGSWPGVPGSGNTYLLGIETDHTVGDPWPDAQVQAIYSGSKALADHYQLHVLIGHKEWAPARKIDPENFDLDAWRAFIRQPSIPTPPPVQPAPVQPAPALSPTIVAAATGTEESPMIIARTTDSKGRYVYGQLLFDGIHYIANLAVLQIMKAAGAKEISVTREQYNAARASDSNAVQ